MSLAKSRVSFKIPGKTFLLGEYVALLGGPSIVAATGPYFEVSFSEGKTKSPFHQDSPAGKYILNNETFFNNVSIDWNDPYMGTGGFGASTAQFIAVAMFHKKHSDIREQKPFNLKNPQLVLDVWQSYRQFFTDHALPPSGADLVAQIVGGVSSFSAETKSFEKREWPFNTALLSLLKTPYKVKTHEHLQTVDVAQLPIEDLKASVQEALTAIDSENFSAFAESSKRFSYLLGQAECIHPDSQQLIKTLNDQPGVLLARGCGALGADVIAVYGSAPEITELKCIATIPENLAYGTWMEVR